MMMIYISLLFFLSACLFTVILIIPVIMAAFSIILVFSPILSKIIEAATEKKRNQQCTENNNEDGEGCVSNKSRQELFLYIWAILILLFGYVVYFVVAYTKNYGVVKRNYARVSRAIQATFGVVSEEKEEQDGTNNKKSIDNINLNRELEILKKKSDIIEENSEITDSGSSQQELNNSKTKPFLPR
jgi:ABC-type multidrug transport system fused ATPase/permease subunit